jgi:hypothetical protein
MFCFRIRMRLHQALKQISQLAAGILERGRVCTCRPQPPQEQSEEVPICFGCPTGAEQEGELSQKLRDGPLHSFRYGAQGLQNVGSPEHEVEERVGSFAGVVERAQAGDQGQPELAAFMREPVKSSCGRTTFPTTLASVAGQVPQVLASVHRRVQQTPDAATPAVQPPECPAGIAHDCTFDGSFTQKFKPVFHKLTTQAANEMERLIVRRANGRAAPEAAEVGGRGAEARSVNGRYYGLIPYISTSAGRIDMALPAC